MAIYFAYGSNLSSRQMRARCPAATPCGPALLAGFVLSFDRPSRRWGGHAADVVPRPGTHVWGVLWRLTDNDLVALDRFEGVATRAYARSLEQVTLPSSRPVAANVYRVVTPGRAGAPSGPYLHTILEGAREHSLPASWIHYLQSFRP